MEEYLEKYNEWLNDPIFDDETKRELLEIKDDKKEIEDRFYKELEFGTGGLRGILGAGTNRMNLYTVGKATQGLANYIIKKNRQNDGVVISYDSRNMSPEFAKQTALIFNANGIKTYLFSSLRPVPVLSFAVRELKCAAGIMITASHNVAKYNGYKVYWDDGAQVSDPIDKEIIEEVRAVDSYSSIKVMNIFDAEEQELYKVIDKEIDDKYMSTLKGFVLNPEVIERQKDLCIVYTPLHGTGNIPVQRILKEIGFENVNVVPEQAEPNGNFPTVEFPNPEYKDAFKLALDLAEKLNADVVLATDPDADRLGIYAKDSKTGEYVPFTGNMSALLIAEYRFAQLKEKGKMPDNGLLVQSIVSTEMSVPVCEKYGIKKEDVLTGFKYIGKRIKDYENGEYSYLFGFEESYGCLFGTYARDKDGVAACMELAEAAAYYKEKGMTLYDEMEEMYEEYGYFLEDLAQDVLNGREEIEMMNKRLENARKNLPSKFGDIDIERIRDYESGEIIDLRNGEKCKLDTPKSNVLYFELPNNEWFAVRPSGTEPKVKYYYGVRGKSKEDAVKRMDYLKKVAKI